MTDLTDYQAWADFMKASRGYWTVDPIHDGVNRPDMIVFRGRTEQDGVFIILDGKGNASAGTYEGATSHIADAIFNVRWEKQFDDARDAYSCVCERLGVPFLMATIFGRSPYRQKS